MKYNEPLGAATNAPYVNHNPSLGIDGSIPPAAAIEHPQREIVAVITNAGLTPAEGDLDQLDEAINIKIAAGGSTDTSTFKTVTSGPSTSPPGSPAAGDEVLVADSPSGAFSGQARKLARFNGTAWAFTTVRAGRMFRVNNTDTYWTLHASTGWQNLTVPIAFVSGLQAALDLKVVKTGDTMTGELTVDVAAGASAYGIKAAGSTRYTLALYDQGGGNYALGVYGYGGVAGTGWRAVFDTNGRLGVGTVAPAAKLDVNGDAMVRGNTILVTDTGAKLIVGRYSSGFPLSIVEAPAGATGMSFQFAGTQQFQFTSSGGLGLGPANDIGTAAKVLVGGTPAAWVDISTLFPGGTVRARMACNYGGLFSQGGLNTSAINATCAGVGITAASNLGGWFDYTFGTAQPNTAYTVVGIDQTQISNKTTSGFRYTPGASGAIAHAFAVIG